MTALSTLLIGAVCASGVTVQAASTGMLDLEAKAAPLSAVLECLTEQTGLKIINTSGVLPVRRVTLSLRAKTEVQIIAELLTEAGLNYALTMDRSGARVGMLLLMGPRSSTTSGSGPASAAGAFQPYPTGVPTDDDSPSPSGLDQIREQLRARSPEYNPAMPGSPVWPPPLGPYPQPSPELYPEPHPLSPVSLREARRIPTQRTRAVPQGPDPRPKGQQP